MMPRSRLTELAENIARHPRVLNYFSPTRPNWRERVDDLMFLAGGCFGVVMILLTLVALLLSIVDCGAISAIVSMCVYAGASTLMWNRKENGPSQW